MLTALGKALRVLRMERGWLMKDMADGLGWSSPFLSAIETGRKPVPDDFIERLTAWIDLSDEEEEAITRAYAQSARDFKIKTPANMSPADREAAALLARTFGSLPSEDIAQIRELILRRKA